MTGVLAALAMATLTWGQTLTIIQTASTNRPELRIGVGRNQPELTALSNGTKAKIHFSAAARTRLWKALDSAGPLASLPVVHCAKSVSFGSSLFVELDGQRSPDLSCDNQLDTKTAILRNELRSILHTVTAKLQPAQERRWKED